ncbi:hypothetical protein [Nannocystis pusilla]|uniref:hypothetical protein n=1 Tax=Nannocystis pusilla TaxID=889268 RepID=UPI003B77BAC0
MGVLRLEHLRHGPRLRRIRQRRRHLQGPVCCDSESDCAEKLGKQANCASGQKCTCRGELECVGEECTCGGGVLTDRGLCYPE